MGFDAYVHVPKENRSKLDNKVELFIRFKDGINGYRLWKSINKKIVSNPDVVFREVKYVPK